MQLDTDQSDEVEDRRDERGFNAPHAAHLELKSNIQKVAQKWGPRTKVIAPEGSLQDQAGNNDLGFADGGPVDDDGDNDGDNGENNLPAIPTEDSTDTPGSMDSRGQADQAQQPTPVPSSSAPIPNQPQSPNPVSELLALVRAVNQYGLHMAQQADAYGQAGAGQSQQVGAYANGGVIRSFEGGGDTDDDTTGAIPTQQAQPAPGYKQEGPFLPSEERLNTREMALDKQGGMGAFGASQKAKIAQGRQDIAQNGPAPGETEAPGAITPPHEMLRGAWNNSAVGKATSSLINYFRGEHAMDGQTKSAIDYDVNKNGALPGNIAAQQGVSKAYIRGLENSTDVRQATDIARAYMQAARREYDGWRNGAAQMLNKGDIRQAIDGANKAFSKGPFDNLVTFMPTQTGVVGTVTDPTGVVVSQHPMDHDQFASWLQQGAQYDKLLHDGVSQTLDTHLGTTQQPAQPQAPAAEPAAPQRPARANNPEGTYVPEAWQKSGVDQGLWEQAMQMFPWASQQGQRTAWLARQGGGRLALQQKQTHDENQALQQQLGREQRSRIAAETERGRQSRHEDTEINRNARQQNSLTARLQMAHDRLMSSATPADKNAARVLKQVIDLNPNDPDTQRRELAKAGLDYDKLLGLSAGPSGQPQGTPQAGGGGSAGAPQSGAQGGAGAYDPNRTAGQAGLTKGAKSPNGKLIWNGGPNDRIGDVTKWTKAQ